ncbi:carboxymuconolactone decarboxylase family protein [Mycolicibacterium goodii]|uniref:carboxymuconolactone decarboxylase family protein n=1 Tax=Mycolicibacterium goodii TaxID=134601 RepID=UPI001BDC489A|nr:carboxymuconolactone decarboxylase family protein [Mycolicibacterium goodii]MBU8816811.1 carboxymuconolactone decarboxylase family protein [Mycolicibacterium goodii]MBU8828294.1 carboxymuconolactone decarboxylase family protein [Mycolicibacterium goodii]
MHYHDSTDSEFMTDLRSSAPEMVDAFFGFDKAVFSQKHGNLSASVRELIAVAVAMTTQCPYCIDIHTRKAKQTGASQAEIAEAVMIAAALRAGGALTHGWLAMKVFNDE